MLRRTLDELVAACHRAVLAEIAETGLALLSMEGVARRARVAKTSIYRHWSTTDELLLDALTAAGTPCPAAPTGEDLRTDLVRSLEQLIDWLASTHALVITAILNERHRHPDLLAAIAEGGFNTRTQCFTPAVLEHYGASGHICAELITPVVKDIGEALVIKYRTDTGSLPGLPLLEEIVDQAILPAVGHRPAVKP